MFLLHNIVLSQPQYLLSMKKLVVVILLFGIGVVNTIAQSDEASVISNAPIISDEMIDRSVFMDTEERICYVDLEQVHVNLKQAAIINNHGDEVLVMSLIDQPVDTIIELDYSDLPHGTYMLELRSYTGKTLKAIQL